MSIDTNETGHWLTDEDVIAMTPKELEALERAQYGGREG